MELVLAGGCFWCIAMPFYGLEGVQQVISGYMGGTLENPTYEQVKSNLYHHKEVIKIIYDQPTDYKQLIDTYFDNIDPFDSEGQYIDRGENYTLAIYSNDEYVIEYAKKVIKHLEEISNKTVYVSILPLMPFYPAEEYHQDYGLKNPDKIEEEFKLSGRKK